MNNRKYSAGSTGENGRLYRPTPIREKKISLSQQNQRINAIRFYYEKVLIRYVQLAQSTLNLLRQYYRKEKPVIWLFEGTNGKQYSATSTGMAWP